MKIEQRAKEYCKVYTQSVPRGAGFEAGSEWLRSELLLFLAANPKATTKQIENYLNEL